MRLAFALLLALLTVTCHPYAKAPQRPADFPRVTTYYLGGDLTEDESQAILVALSAWFESTSHRQRFEATNWYAADVRFFPLRQSEYFRTVAGYQGENWADLRGLWVAKDRTVYLLIRPICEVALAVVASHEIGHSLDLYADSPTFHIREPGTESLMWPHIDQFPRDGIARGIPIADVIEWQRVRGGGNRRGR